jgi:hypothetical protein
MALLNLTEPIQQRVLDGEADALTIEELGKLNRYAAPEPLDSATEPNSNQRQLLAALGMENLVDDTRLTTSLTPR